MERVREKLHSRTGASLLIALLFFLVAMTVGAVVLTAASANAGRIQKNRQEQQNYLAVASAAELVKEDIAGRPGTAFTASYQKVVTEYSETWTDAEGKSHTRYRTETYYREGTAPSVGNGKLLEAARSDLGKLYYSVIWNPEIWGNWSGSVPEKVPPERIQYSLKLSGDAGAGLPEVTGTLTVIKEEADAKNRSRYTVLVTLQDEDGKNPMTLTFPAEVKRATSTQGGNPTITTYTTTVTWSDPQVTRGAEP